MADIKTAKKKILVIDDELHIAEGVKVNLELQGHQVRLALNGIEGLKAWKEWSPDLVVLDLMMPGVDGYTVLEKIREEDEKLPILVLSAKDASRDKVKCLAGGVDDYLSKPFNLEEFLLRVDRLLVRSGWSHGKPGEDKELEHDTVEFGKNKIDFTLHRAWTARGEIQLTAQESEIIKLFVQNEGRPLSRGELLEHGWGYSQEATSRTVDNFLVRFRKYFEEDPKNPAHFKSIRSVGYMFER